MNKPDQFVTKNNSRGGSDIQFDLLKKYVNIKDNVIHRIPNPFAKSIYHIDDIINQKETNILWVQQSYDMIESMSVLHHYDALDKVIFVSNWQQRKYVEVLKCSEEKCIVIENGIEPIEQHTKPTGTINLVYMSTPYRGLDVLLQAFQYIQDMNVHLHVFSSMKIYGQDHEDLKYQHLYKFCKNHPKITYYGSVSHRDMINSLKEIHVIAYPSTFEETSCISVLEAMSAQCAVVCSNLGALPETTNRFANMYCYREDKLKHAEIFAQHLRQTVFDYKQQNYKLQKEFVDYKYSWKDNISNKWNNMFKTIDKNNMICLNYD
jgi:glycosyltransferase involved in cell wall biosynthesis